MCTNYLYRNNLFGCFYKFYMRNYFYLEYLLIIQIIIDLVYDILPQFSCFGNNRNKNHQEVKANLMTHAVKNIKKIIMRLN